MKCVKCMATVPEGRFCLICGWEQKKLLFTPALEDVYKQWKRRHFRKLTPKGRTGYENAWRFLLPIKHYPIDTIGITEYQDIIDSQAAFSKSHQEKIKQLISQVCKEAILMEYIHVNYGQFLVLDGYASKSYVPFSDNEIKVLLKAAERFDPIGETARIILIYIFTGWRPEELFSIKREQVDIERRCLISGSKTEAGKNRIVTIAPIIYRFVLNLYYHTKPGDFLVKSPTGKRVTLGNWRSRKFYPCLQKLGINTSDDPYRIKPYSTRHTFATLAYRAGVKPEILTKLIGHTNFDFTMETYIHNQVDELAVETNKISAYFKSLFESEECT